MAIRQPGPTTATRSLRYEPVTGSYTSEGEGML